MYLLDFEPLTILKENFVFEKKKYSVELFLNFFPAVEKGLEESLEKDLWQDIL